MIEIGSRLKSERIRLGLTQRDFASLGGVQTNAQSQYEHGRRSPTAAYLKRLANSGVDVLYVITGDKFVDPKCEAMMESIEFGLIVAHLPEQERLIIKELVLSLRRKCG